MFVKIVTIALMAFIATSHGDEVWDGFSARWAGNPADGFYHLPENLKDAESQGWTEISGATRVSQGLKAVGYFGDPRFVLLFVKHTGTIIGHQIGIPVADIEDAGVPINYTSNPAITKKNLNGENYFTATALYHKNEGKNSRKIWLEVNDKFVEIPTKPKLLTRTTSYYSKRCVTWMGHHYYKIKPTMNCSEIFPWFLLRVEDDIIGIGFQAIGNASAAPKRTWFENIPPTQQAYTIPDAPACVGEGIQKHGVISFHVWFRKDPLAIACKGECTAVYNSTRDGFYTLPQTLDAAVNEGWIEVTDVNQQADISALGYHGDPRIVLLYSMATGKVVGHQVGIPVADIENAGVPIDYAANSAVTIKTLNGEDFYTATAYYSINEDTGTRRIWFQVDGDIVVVPTTSDLVTQETRFYSKRCVTWMGHHFYQITPTTDCSNVFPWFLTSVGNDIIGIGFQSIGTAGATPARTWFETIPFAQQTYTIPDAPECINEGMLNYGVISFHVWFKKDPLDIICEDECTAAYNSAGGSGQFNDGSGKRRKRAEGSANVCPV